MCRSSNYNKYPVTASRGGSADNSALLQALRIKIWQIIARNNAEELTDPLAEPLEDPILYGNDVDFSDVPSLDEIMPLPASKQAATVQANPTPAAAQSEAEKLDPKPQSEDNAPDGKQKKLKLKDLMATPSEEPTPSKADFVPQSEATSKTDAQATQATTAQAETKPAAAQSATPKLDPTPAVQSEEAKATKKEKEPSILQRFLDWYRARKERKDYFRSLKMQIKNKNAACYELLEFIATLEDEV